MPGPQMNGRDAPPRPMPAALWLGLIMALALIFAASLTRRAEAQTYSGTIEPCLSTHGERDLYRAGLIETGWTDIPADARPAALDMLTDAWLPIILGTELPIETLIARRAEARAFWEDFSRNRTVMERQEQVLLLAGIVSDDGQMIVECWVAGPAAAVTDDLIGLVGAMISSPGIEMAQINLAADSDRPETEFLVTRLSLESPTLAATDGLRTTILFRPGANL